MYTIKPKFQKPDTCQACPLYEKGLGFVPDKLSKKIKYLFIGEAPGKNEVIEGEPFVGQAGFVLKNWGIRAVPGMQLAYDRGEVSFGNTLRCLPPEVQGRPYPKGAEKLQSESCCSQYKQDVGRDFQTIVLFGESPQRERFGDELAAEDASDKRLGRDLKGVGGRIGRTIQKAGTTYVFAPHPAWVLRQPSLVEHLQNSLRIATGEERPMEPAYTTNWDGVVDELRSRE